MEINTPNYENLAHQSMQANIKLNRDIYAGQERLRNATYLTKYEGESTDGYDLRLKTSYLNNKLSEKIATSNGLILNKPITATDAPEYISNDIDGNNSTIDQFALQVLKDGEIDGHSFILVDSQTTTPENLAAQEANNIHPYWIIILASQVINWKTDNINGQQKLTQITIKEVITEDNGKYGEAQTEQYKVYFLNNNIVTYELWRVDAKGNLAIHQEETATSFTTIPLIPFYANRVANMVSRPPFLNVANNTLNAFQLGSQKNRALKQVGDPDKAIFSNDIQSQLQSEDNDSGVKETTLTFGADITQVFGTEDRYEFIEPTGKGVELLGLEIDRIEKFVDGIGAELNEQSNMSATEASIRNSKATAEDVVFSINLEQSLNEALQLTKQVDSQISENAYISINREFAKSELSDQTLTILNTMVMSGNLSREEFLKSIGSGELPKFLTEEDIAEEIERLQQEGVNAIEEIEE